MDNHELLITAGIMTSDARGKMDVAAAINRAVAKHIAKTNKSAAQSLLYTAEMLEKESDNLRTEFFNLISKTKIDETNS